MKNFIKILTFTIPMTFISGHAFAGQILNQVNFKTHLRWNIFANKKDVFVSKKGTDVIIKTLNMNIFDQLKSDVESIQSGNRYLNNIKINNVDVEAGMVGSIAVHLSSEDVELFSFYRDSEKKHVLDFWIDEDAVKTKAAAIKPKQEAPKVAPKKVVPVKVEKKETRPASFKKLTRLDEVRIENSKEYRDYRYGASFIWDYEANSPVLKKTVNIDRKTPEYFYPVRDRSYEKNEKEAHLQLSINLFRKKKWGLMYKSIKLFEKKYGDEEYADINDYLRANAILKNNFVEGKLGPQKMALNMLANIAERTTEYDLKKGIYKYLIAFLTQHEDHVKTLDLAKKYYVITKDQFDIEEAEYAAEVMLHSLAKLRQIDVLKKLLEDKTIIKMLPKQMRLAYEGFTNLRLNRVNDVIALFENNRKSLAKPIHESILFNTAEAYFRNGDFTKAILLFDQYLAEYSYSSSSDQARVRIALSYELLGKDIKKTLSLYENAINRTSKAELNYEAKIRYVALRTVRKFVTDKSDLERRVFLNNTYGDKFKVDHNIRKLLWLVRLRSFLSDKKFDKALSYLNAIPINSLRPAEKRVFEADGAEIIYGIIVDNYKRSQYSKAVQVWEVYKNRYVDKVAADPFMNFVVAHSYVKLGLFEGFDKVYASFNQLKNTPARSFPIWAERTEVSEAEEMLTELRIIRNIKLNNFKLAQDNIEKLEKISPKYNKVNYYKGILAYKSKQYLQCVENIEKFLANEKAKSIYDSSDIAEMIQSYTNSLYELGQLDKFKKVASAILSDTKSYAVDNKYMNSVKERVAYLEIEILSGEETPASYLLVENKIEAFLRNYAKSTYYGRVSYLNGVAKVANKKDSEGKKIFSQILENKDVSEYIKGLVRTELALLKIKERTI